jgi:hypothetical protein
MAGQLSGVRFRRWAFGQAKERVRKLPRVDGLRARGKRKFQV